MALGGILWAGLIFFSSTAVAGRLATEFFSRHAGAWARRYSIPQSAFATIDFVAEKSVHLVLFFVFGVLLWNVFPRCRRRVGNVLAAACIVGVLSETLQMFFVTRDPTVRDALFNGTGAALGIGACLLARRVRCRIASASPLATQNTSGV